MTPSGTLDGYGWLDGRLPHNVHLGERTLIAGDKTFQRMFSQKDPALAVGEDCILDGVHFAMGRDARVSVGDRCSFSHAVLLSELEIRIGHNVVIGWNATIADTDFHPLDPAERISDAIACSPQGRALRPEVPRLRVVIENDVWIGPNATVLKGVRIGRGALIEPGSLVARDVPQFSRVIGNPARVVGSAP